MNNKECDTFPSAKSGQWNWLWSSIISGIMAIIVVKFFGPVGGLITLGSYYLLNPKLGVWRAIAAPTVLGIVVAIGLGAIIR